MKKMWILTNSALCKKVNYATSTPYSLLSSPPLCFPRGRVWQTCGSRRPGTRGSSGGRGWARTGAAAGGPNWGPAGGMEPLLIGSSTQIWGEWGPPKRRCSCLIPVEQKISKHVLLNFGEMLLRKLCNLLAKQRIQQQQNVDLRGNLVQNYLESK